ncbi:MAG: hypothetical protein HC887_06805 [Desulfobacteraceae bacterium]|nr:hypothetical protein [Desulfobacteraceae bacterium]
MLSFIYNIFRRLFGKPTQSAPLSQEKPVHEEKIKPPRSPEPERKKVIDIREKIRHQQQKKHANRLAHREKQSVKDKKSESATPTSKIGIPLLSERDDLAKLFNISDKKIVFRTSETWEEVLLQKESVPEKPKSLKEQLKKYPEPNKELDLHGFSSVQAVIRTETFISESIRQKLKTVRVIVGKGLHSEGKAVLKEVVEDKLARMKQDGFIFNFRWEKDSKLRSGAIIVYLHQ